MKRKHILLTGLVCLLLLVGFLGWQLLSSYSICALTVRPKWRLTTAQNVIE